MAGLQNALQKVQLLQARTQAVDPEGLLVTVDGPTNVRFACEPQAVRSQTPRRQQLASAALALTDALALILLFQDVQRCSSLGKVVVHLRQRLLLLVLIVVGTH